MIQIKGRIERENNNYWQQSEEIQHTYNWSPLEGESLPPMEEKKYLKQYFKTKSTHDIKNWKWYFESSARKNCPEMLQTLKYTRKITRF